MMLTTDMKDLVFKFKITCTVRVDINVI